MPAQADSFLESSRPVHDERDGRRRRVFDERVDEKALTVGRDVIGIGIQSYKRAWTNPEQRSLSDYLELRSLAVDRCGNQCVIGRQVDNLSSVAPPSRPTASGGGHSLAVRAGPVRSPERKNIDFQSR